MEVLQETEGEPNIQLFYNDAANSSTPGPRSGRYHDGHGRSCTTSTDPGRRFADHATPGNGHGDRAVAGDARLEKRGG